MKLFSTALNFRFWLITALRSALWCVIVFALNVFLDSQSPSIALYLSAILGCLFGSILGVSRLKLLGFAALLTAASLASMTGSWLLFQLPLPISFEIQSLIWLEELSTAKLIGILTCISSWLFWRYGFGLAVESLTLILSFIAILAGHRNYRFDLIKLVNDLAWDLRYSPLEMLIILGAGFISLIILFLISQNIIGRPNPEFKARVYYKIGRPSYIITLLTLALIVALASTSAYFVLLHHQKQSATQLSNGVGQEEQEGLSPLTFHQSLGKSNQPMALLRLDSEYQNNPDSPSLYLREIALSKVKGNEIVIANTRFDEDAPKLRPGQSLARDIIPDKTLIERPQLVQSVYLIAKHKLLFAIDYPIKINQLQLPRESKRFKSAFRAYSLVPQYDRNILKSLEVGSKEWDDTTWKHYLETHADQRYRELAEKVTAGYSSKSEKAHALVDYLSKNAIYTLTPNHAVGKEEDQTAAFLFGDLRGYCVHFAHASVYMFRSIGIPARIGTGYMNDLSEARDGHVLLRSSDRHAWAEVYFENIGWVPMDTQPEQVESHAETPVDMDLLDQLMSEIGPDTELLPEAPTNEFPDETLDNPIIIEAQLLVKIMAALILFALFVLYSAKVFVRQAWRIQQSDRRRLVYLYRSTVSILQDLGLPRRLAETRSEYRERIKQNLQLDLLALTPNVLAIIYNSESRPQSEIVSRLQQEKSELVNQLSLQQKFKLIASPISGFNFLTRRSF
jgi:transglutaminase-like putative cysteine protease